MNEKKRRDGKLCWGGKISTKQDCLLQIIQHIEGIAEHIHP